MYIRNPYEKPMPGSIFTIPDMIQRDKEEKPKEAHIEKTEKGLWNVYNKNDIWLGEFRFKRDAQAFADLKNVQEKMKPKKKKKETK